MPFERVSRIEESAGWRETHAHYNPGINPDTNKRIKKDTLERKLEQEEGWEERLAKQKKKGKKPPVSGFRF